MEQPKYTRFTLAQGALTMWGKPVRLVIIDGQWACMYRSTRKLSADYVGAVDWQNVPAIANAARGY